MAVPASLFKKYDIRGVAQGDAVTLSPEAAEQIGLAIGAHFIRQYGQRLMMVGRDNRMTSPVLAAALVDGLVAAGCNVIQLGQVATPLVYWHAYHNKAGGVMVTGSHLAPQYNGFKLCHRAENIWGDELQRIYALLESGATLNADGGKARPPAIDHTLRYIVHTAQSIHIDRPLKVVVDAGNGTAGPIAMELLRHWKQEAEGLFIEPDGFFPNHLPNPQEAANVAELGRRVVASGADIGLAFDGDSDRVGVVNERGQLISADRILALLAQDMLARNPGAAVVGEVLCSQTLFDVVAAAGGVGHLAPSGHSVVKAKMREVGALLGGEVSGHIFLSEDFYGVDDAFVVAGRILRLLAASDKPLSALDDALPRYYSTPEYRPHCPDADKASVIAGVAAALQGTGDISTVDGVRVRYERGWGILRASNTEPVLSLRFEGQSEADAQAIQARFVAALAAYPQVAALEA